MEKKLLQHALKSGADQAEVFTYTSMSTQAVVRMGDQEQLQRSNTHSTTLRVFLGQKTAVVATNELNEATVAELAERAVAMAELSPEDPHVALASEAVFTHHCQDLTIYDEKEPPVEKLLAMAEEAEAAALAVQGISNSEGAEASYAASEVALLTSEGFEQRCQASLASVSVSVLAEQDGVMERDYEYHKARFLSDVMAAKDIGTKAGERTLARLGAKKPKTGRYPVVFEPRVARGLIGHFLSAINGNAVASGTSFLKNQLGERIFPEAISITDDPFLMKGLSSRPFDAEGLEGKKLALVEEGRLNHFLLDLRSASKLGSKSNGRASRGIGSAPHPASTNVLVSAGKQTAEELLQEIGTGLLVNETFGMGVNQTTGDFSQGAAGFWVENGKIAYPISEFTIASTLPQMFSQMVAANDIDHASSIQTPSLCVGEMAVA